MYQDWKPVTFHKMGGAAVSKVGCAHATHSQEQKKFRQLDSLNLTDSAAPIQERVSVEDRKEITQLRILKKLTQDQLNIKMNLQKDTIKRIENGTHEKNKGLTNRIKDFLKKTT
uniref:HTH cro/C1-type domain-containing protein n=1 Tax=viral metagenome TaxID=1070528 RepID=A0A6C0I464_9ZZZZ